MLEIGPQHTMNYRQEILTRFFDYVQSAESFYLIGAASMGKTRLMDFLMQADVQKHYLTDQAERIWLIRVDLNRLAIKNEDWAFFELLLSSILLETSNHENVNDLRTEITQLDSQVIQNRDMLRALRFFELTVSLLCHFYDKKIVFLFDEFDETYKALPKETFSQLRAVRDANKNLLSYAVFLRDLPERLRPNRDNESFYELMSANMLKLGPYTRSDAIEMMLQIEVRRGHSLTQAQREKVYEASGGQSGLIKALLGILIDVHQADKHIESANWLEWLGKQDSVVEECRKIWEGLSKEEQDGLNAFIRGETKEISSLTGRTLLAKGLLQNTGTGAKFFSHLFEQYVKRVSTHSTS